MSAAAYALRTDAQRFIFVRYFREIAAFVIMFCVINHYPGTAKISAMVWLGMTAVLMVVRRNELGAVLLRWWPMLLAPLLAPLSALWSDWPAIAGKYGPQLFLVVFAALIVGRVLSPSRAMVVTFLVALVVCVLSILSRRHGAADGGLVLIGLLGSKNQMSTIGCLLFTSALAVLMDSKAAKALRLLSIVGVLVGVYIVQVTDSATAMLVTALTAVLLPALVVMHKLQPAGRVAVVLALALVIAPIFLALSDVRLAIEDFVVNTLHKDMGLTGRDYLWERAIEFIKLKPLLGYGFQVIWLSETPDTDGLLKWANVRDGRTFNFHNTYIQFAVDCGIVGATAFAVSIGLAVLAAARQYILAPSLATTFFFVLLLQSFARSFTEALLGAFATSTFLLYMSMVYPFWRPSPGWGDEEAGAAQAPPHLAPAPMSGGYAQPGAGLPALTFSGPPGRRPTPP